MDKPYKKINYDKKPIKTRWYLLPLIWIIVTFMLFKVKHKIIKENFKKIKGGCLIVSNHMCFTDFKLLEKFLFPRRSYYISSIDEFVYKEWIMRRLGCIPKKVHFRDMKMIRTIVKLLKKGNIVSLYPEATYSFAGVENMIDQSLGKLAKMANVPVIVINQKGNYLYSPRWNTKPVNKEVPLIFNAKMVVNKDEVAILSADEIQNRINECFPYDEYKYQRENNIKIHSSNKACHIDRILYKCPNCLCEKCIEGINNEIHCTNCNATYEIDELSILKNKNGETKFDSISSWFTFQRKFVKEDINNNKYDIEFPVKISKLLNCKLGFDHNFAKGIARQNNDGIKVYGKINETNENFYFEYNQKLNSTIHVTYDVKGCQDSGVEVHDENNSYLLYPLDKTPVIKIRFAVEEAHIKYQKELKK